MSSRSKGVRYCVLRSVIRSRVIVSPAVSAAFTCSCVTVELGCSRKRRSTSRATSSAFSPAFVNSTKNSVVRGVSEIFIGAHGNRTETSVNVEDATAMGEADEQGGTCEDEQNRAHECRHPALASPGGSLGGAPGPSRRTFLGQEGSRALDDPQGRGGAR